MREDELVVRSRRQFWSRKGGFLGERISLQTKAEALAAQSAPLGAEEPQVGARSPGTSEYLRVPQGEGDSGREEKLPPL